MYKLILLNLYYVLNSSTSVFLRNNVAECYWVSAQSILSVVCYDLYTNQY